MMPSWMTVRIRQVLLALLVLPAGRTYADAGSPTSAASTGVDPARALLPLAQLTPAPAAPKRSAAVLEDLPERAQQAMAQAAELRGEGRFTEATIELEKAARLAGDDPRVHRELAMTQWEAGDATRVQRHVDAALGVVDDDLVCHYLLGRLAARRFDNAAALRHFQTALLCTRDEGTRGVGALTSYHLAETLMAEGYLTAAIEVYQRFEQELAALGDAPGPVELNGLRRAVPMTAAERLATAYAQLGRHAEAADQFSRAFPEGAMQPADRRRFAELLLEAGRTDEALIEARAVVLSDVAAIGLLTEVHARRGTPGAVVDDLRQMIADHPENTALTQALAQALQSSGREDEAVAVLRERAQASPDNAELRWALFDTYAGRRDWPAALRAAAAAIAADPEASADADLRLQGLPAEACGAAVGNDAGSTGFAQAYVAGFMAAKCGDADAAIAEYERSVAARATFVAARVCLGRMHLARFEWNAAIAAAQPEGVELPEDSRLECILGQAKVGLSQVDEAAEHLRKSVRLNRANSEAMLALALLYRERGELNRSLRQLQTLVDLDPLNERGREMLLLAYLADNDRRAAVRQLEELRRISASPTCIARCVVRLEYRQDKVDTTRFRQTLEEAIAAHRPDADTLFLIALAYMEERRFADAAGALEQAVALEPGHRESAETLVTAYRANLEFEKALAQRRLLRTRYPNRPEWREDEIELLLIVQRFDEVIAEIQAWLGEKEITDEQAEALRETLISTHLLREDYASALALVEELRAADPENGLHLRRLIAINQRLGRHERALELLQRWPEDVPDGFAAGWTSIIWRELPKEHYHAVTQLVLESVEKDPRRDALQLALIELLTATGDYAGALSLTEANAKDSRFSEVFEDTRVEILNAAGRVDEAIAAVRERLIVTPEDEQRMRLSPFDLRQRLVQLLIKAGKAEQARAELHRWLAELEQQAGPVGEALGAGGDEALAVERMFYLGLLSIVHQETNDLAESLQTLELILQNDPADAGASNDLGYTLCDAGRELERAEALSRYAVANQPRNSAFLDTLGWVLYKRGDFAGAKLWLTRARYAGSGEDPVVCDHLGDACWRLGEREEAQKWWKQAQGFAEESQGSAWPSPTHGRTLAAVRAKLAAAAEGQEPAVAEVVEKESK